MPFTIVTIIALITALAFLILGLRENAYEVKLGAGLLLVGTLGLFMLTIFVLS